MTERLMIVYGELKEAAPEMTRGERLLAKLHKLAVAESWDYKERDALCEIIRELIERTHNIPGPDK